MKYLFAFFVLMSNTLSTHAGPKLLPGEWRADLAINDTMVLPFNFTVEGNQLTIRNSDEKILVDEITYSNDSVIIRLPVFDAEIRAAIVSEFLVGDFINHARKTKNILSFRAMHNASFRFSEHPAPPSIQVSGKWKVVFDNEDPESKVAVGVFKQSGNHLTGTFLTTTGDYRFLEGEVNGNSISLSTFNGAHLFLFTAQMGKDKQLHGHFYSGSHWHDTWSASRDSTVELADPESLTSINPGTPLFDFTFPDENGIPVSLHDARFKNKVVLVELMGTWCPNCLDETWFLAQLYKENKPAGLEVVGLSYEKSTDTNVVRNNILRLKNRTGAEYPILFAGSNDKTEAAKTLPALNRVWAYPTTIFIDRKGTVRRIHTGFSGPATGEEYEKLTQRIKDFTAKLLAE